MFDGRDCRAATISLIETLGATVGAESRVLAFPENGPLVGEIGKAGVLDDCWGRGRAGGGAEEGGAMIYRRVDGVGRGVRCAFA
jgi:hypothetical protein